MSRFSRMCTGLGMLAALAAMPAFADAPADADSAGSQSAERVTRVGTRLPVVVAYGAVDEDGKRWEGSGEKIRDLPTVSESAFLDGEALDGSRP
ncbi:MAG TPA: hypothetical protein VFL14_10185 [Xanthomonadales bacterium]|nr:hypothetical protein [Xanthomonadales bacterium]